MHLQCTGQRPGEYPQQRDEASEEHRPNSPAVEQPFGQHDVPRTEVLGKTLAQLVEKRHAETAPDRVADRIADHRADDGGNPDADRVDSKVVMGRHQRRADQDDLAGQRHAQAFHADHAADHQVDRERRDRMQQSLDIHGSRMPHGCWPRAAMSSVGAASCGVGCALTGSNWGRLGNRPSAADMPRIRRQTQGKKLSCVQRSFP